MQMLGSITDNPSQSSLGMSYAGFTISSVCPSIYQSVGLPVSVHCMVSTQELDFALEFQFQIAHLFLICVARSMWSFTPKAEIIFMQ